MGAASASRYKETSPEGTTMVDAHRPEKDSYSEAEAAEALNITLERLYRLLDEHIFNDGSARPQTMSFRTADLVLLSFWNRTAPTSKLLRMPRRS